MSGTQRRGSGAPVLSSSRMPVAANCSALSCALASSCPSRSRMAARSVRSLALHHAPARARAPAGIGGSGGTAAAAAAVRAEASAAITCSARAPGACMDIGGVVGNSERYAVALASLRSAEGPNGSAAEISCPRTATSLSISTARATPTAAAVPLGSTPSSARSGACSVTAVATRSASSLA
eukprot:6177547-Pleurochrysis_carterae.AAC.2